MRNIDPLPKATRYGAALAACLAGLPAAHAATLEVGIDIPRMDVAEYHRPYVAAWVERADNSVAGTLAVWYDVKKRDNEGAKWLKDLRQWWRRTGRDLSMPVDGVSAPTRPVGAQTLSVSEGTAALPKLPPGDYKLVIEAAREVGGREVVTLPFTWPLPTAQTLTAKGSSELGVVTLRIKP